MAFEDGVPRDPDEREERNADEPKAEESTLERAVSQYLEAERLYQLKQTEANRARAERNAALDTMRRALTESKSGQMTLF